MHGDASIAKLREDVKEDVYEISNLKKNLGLKLGLPALSQTGTLVNGFFFQGREN